MIKLADISFRKNDIGSPALLAKLKETGVVLIDGFYDTETTAKLNEEFFRLLDHKEPYLKKFDYSMGRGVSFITKELDKSVYPETASVFAADFMTSITHAYFSNEVESNVGVYVVNDVVGNRHHANDMHFDVQRSIKFFIYLTDTTAQNGAFWCVPGTVPASQKIRQKYGADISYENRELSRQLPYKESDSIPMEGSAGTLIIFDTDVFHKAGIVHEGERRVMRGYSTFVKAPAKKEPLLKRIFK